MKPIIRLKIKEIIELQKKHGINDVQLADRSYLNPSQIGWVKKGFNRPGEDFIAGMLCAFPDKKFDDLFFLELPLQEGQGNEFKPTVA